MMGRALSIGLFFLVVSCLNAHSVLSADSDRLFIVHGLQLDMTAATATKARQMALAKAQQMAWTILGEKLVSDETRNRLPKPSSPLLERLVRAVDIRNERSSATRYLAEIDVAFHADAVRDLYTQLEVSYTESKAGPYLLLPAYVETGRLHLFTDHAWKQALESADRRNRLISYKIPEANIHARRFLSPQRLVHAKPQDLAEIAAQFQVAKAVVAKAELSFDYASQAYRLDYTLTIGPLDEQDGEALGPRRGHLIGRPEESRDDLLNRAANQVLQQADAAWKSRTLIKGREPTKLSVKTVVRNFDDWLTFRKRLQEIAIIRDVEITAMRLPVSEFEISYVGTDEQLQLALSEARLKLRTTASGTLIEFAAPPVDESVQGDNG